MQPESFAPPLPFDIRGRCACGKRYRIRNATVGTIVTCPSCRRPIAITDADVKAALADQPLQPIQNDAGELREAILIDHGGLTLAPEGSAPGLTGRVIAANSEATVNSALRGLRPRSASGMFAGGGTPRVVRPFALDLVASFYFAGVQRNAVNIFVMAIAICAPTLILMLGSYGTLPLAGILQLIVMGYMIQFYWSVMRLTNDGEDEIPWVQSDWSWWDDCVMPFVWLWTISIACSAPALIAEWLMPNLPLRAAMIYGLFAAGWMLWPVAVMTIALTDSWYYLRPDWLLRCVVAIGPLYLMACAILVSTVIGWFGFTWLLGAAIAWIETLSGWGRLFAKIGAGLTIPVLSGAVNLYLGYVLFRTLGLLFRHRRQQLPWRF